ncbi:chaperone DnaJ-domain superfamily protein [Actinidia rufa]|uniref:Chaperone DnaJ-domain superfamily protein n=1 Tax=Actinidia rufa TaxID=165716 RepID=A0A7J0DYA2_9ERIC|nr:chaperone DnaJ-domain superfamily protein [Actinidia rufa]
MRTPFDTGLAKAEVLTNHRHRASSDTLYAGAGAVTTTDECKVSQASRSGGQSYPYSRRIASGVSKMEDIGLFKQGWKWLRHCCAGSRTSVMGFRDKIWIFVEVQWPVVCGGCARLGGVLLWLLIYWRDCVVCGIRSIIEMGSAALLIIMWSSFLSLTSMSCLVYVLMGMPFASQDINADMRCSSSQESKAGPPSVSSHPGLSPFVITPCVRGRGEVANQDLGPGKASLLPLGQALTSKK